MLGNGHKLNAKVTNAYFLPLLKTLIMISIEAETFRYSKNFEKRITKFFNINAFLNKLFALNEMSGWFFYNGKRKESNIFLCRYKCLNTINF